MNPRAHKALLESIEKWRQIEAGEMADLGVHNCSLCMEFWDQRCVDCPVQRRTMYSGCVGTPYEEWSDAQSDFDGYLMDTILVADTPALVRLARAERKFLESLLP